MKTNLLIGAISGNYTPLDLKRWVETSSWENCHRVLILYNPSNNGIEEYLKSHNITIIIPDFDFWGNQKTQYPYNTGECTTNLSYDLIHNLRFFHIWKYLHENTYHKVLTTDVKDVYFNSNPFDIISPTHLVATSEIISYKDDEWNTNHLHTNLGLIGIDLLLNKPVYNVGVFGGNYNIIKSICSDIYLMSSGKHKVADQTSYNYLIHTSYKDKTIYTDLSDKLAVHLHVINNGMVNFDLNEIPQYPIIHQYDRIKNYPY